LPPASARASRPLPAAGERQRWATSVTLTGKSQPEKMEAHAMSLFGLFRPPNVEELEAKRDVQGLIKVLGYQKRYNVRQAAIEALGKIGIPAVESLIAALRKQEIDVRQAAAEALGQIGGVHAVEPLIAAFKDDSQQVRKAAAEALGKIGDSRAVEPLIAAF